MGERRLARECALQLLFQFDVSGDEIQEAVEHYWQLKDKASVPVQEFCERIARGCAENAEKIDAIITENADNWRIGRMAVVDRNIMRIAIYEFIYEEDIPPKVTINEAIEIAKKFGGPESTQFINGILDAVHKKLDNYEI